MSISAQVDEQVVQSVCFHLSVGTSPTPRVGLYPIRSTTDLTLQLCFRCLSAIRLLLSVGRLPMVSSLLPSASSGGSRATSATRVAPRFATFDLSRVTVSSTFGTCFDLVLGGSRIVRHRSLCSMYAHCSTSSFLSSFVVSKLVYRSYFIPSIPSEVTMISV